jgi:hypothetical protein
MAMFFPSFVDEETNKDLMAEVTEEELKEIISASKRKRVLGPDGWTIEFFQVLL